MTDQSQSAADRLRELKGLRDDGLISDGEFSEMRAPLLKELGLPADPVRDGAPDESKPQAVPGPTKPPEKNWISSTPMMSIRGLSFLIIGGALLVVVVILAWANYDKIEHWAFPERLAYDTGVESFHMRNAAGTGMSCAYLEEVKDAVGTDRAKAGEVVDDLNALLFDAAALVRTTGDLAYDAEHDQFFVSGVWDEATRTCPDAFDTPTIVGRP